MSTPTQPTVPTPTKPDPRPSTQPERPGQQPDQRPDGDWGDRGSKPPAKH